MWFEGDIIVWDVISCCIMHDLLVFSRNRIGWTRKHVFKVGKHCFPRSACDKYNWNRSLYEAGYWETRLRGWVRTDVCTDTTRWQVQPIYPAQLPGNIFNLEGQKGRSRKLGLTLILEAKTEKKWIGEIVLAPVFLNFRPEIGIVPQNRYYTKKVLHFAVLLRYLAPPNSTSRRICAR